MEELAERIEVFLNKYACISPNWEPGEDDDDKYTSPDAHMLAYCAYVLKRGEKPLRCWSEWGSGGYYPYSSKEGREEHDLLVMEILQIINPPFKKI